MSEGSVALAKAQGLAEIRRYQEALGLLGPAIGDEATAAEAHCVAAQCLLGLQQPGQAAAAARRALAVQPDNVWAHRLLGIAYLRNRERHKAHAEATEAVRLAPNSAHALHLLAICQLAQRQRSAAEQTALIGVAENPQEPLAHLTLGQVAAARRKYDLAERAYREGLRLAPDHADLALGLGRLLHRLGRRDEAAQAYLAAGNANPADIRAREGLARLGLPVAGVGVGVFAIVRVFFFLGARDAIGTQRPFSLALIIGGMLLLAGTVTTLLRIRGTRRLPEAVRAGLRADHRNAALRWLVYAAIGATILAVWAAALPPSKGGGLGEGAGFAAFAIAAGYSARRFWTGPWPTPVEAIRSVGLRWQGALSRYRPWWWPR